MVKDSVKEVEPALPKKNVLLVPPDGGWGWMIILATCVNLMVIPTTVTCFGVMVPFVIREFDADIAAVSWVPGVAVAVLNLAGPWTSAMLSIYSHRRLGVIGTLMVVFAIILSSFAPSMMFFFLSYGLMLGMGCSLSTTMGILITQEYFAQRRPMANGITMAGGSVGQMLIPLVMQGLFDSYGLRGGLLIYSAVVLQSLVAAALFQPSRWHWKLAPIQPTAEATAHVENGQQKPTALPELEGTKGQKVSLERSTSWTGHHPPAPSSPDLRRVHQLRVMRSNSISSTRDAQNRSRPPSQINPTAAVRISLAALSYAGSVGSLASLTPSIYKEAPKSKTLEEMRQELKTRTQQDTRPAFLRWLPRCPAASSILNLQMMKDPFFIIMSVAMALSRLTYQQFNVLVPAFAQSIGVEPTSAAALVTILASADTVARLAVPIMSQIFAKHISTLNICLIEFVLCAAGSFGLALSTDFTGMVISCVIYGFGIGGITALTVVVIVQCLGMDKLWTAFGLNVFIGGLVVFPGIIIIGYIQVLTKSFPICFHIVGGICILCCAMWAPLPWILQRQRNAHK